jgi:hypothetical protein
VADVDLHTVTTLQVNPRRRRSSKVCAWCFSLRHITITPNCSRYVKPFFPRALTLVAPAFRQMRFVGWFAMLNVLLAGRSVAFEWAARWCGRQYVERPATRAFDLKLTVFCSRQQSRASPASDVLHDGL